MLPVGRKQIFNLCILPKRTAFYYNYTGKKEDEFPWRIADDYPSKTKVGPERDLVNFPRLNQNTYPPLTRLNFLPNRWFEFFYPKTGVTGPYLFLGGLVTTLLQKEIWVVEAEFLGGTIMFLTIFGFMKKYGNTLKEYYAKQVQDDIKEAQAIHQKHIDYYKEHIEIEKVKQRESQAPKYIAEFQRDNVALQQEALYRERLLELYQSVKKRLDYRVELANIRRKYEHENMIDWIIQQVYKSITPQLQKEALQKCIVDLKHLSKTAQI